MLVRKDMGYAILLGVGVLTIGGLLGATWVSANFSSMMEDQVKQAELIRLQGASKIYHKRLDTYQGLCGDVGLQVYYSCNEGAETFAISVPKENGLYYCIDSTGHFGEQILPVRKTQECLK